MIPWYQRVAPYPKQQAAIFDPPRHSLIEASPKSGKTLGCLQWLIEETERIATRIDHPRFLWVAPVLWQAEIAFTRAYQEVLKEEDIKLHLTNRTIMLPSGAIIVFKSAERPRLIYGEDYYGAVVDEASDMKYDAWRAIRSTTNATGARIRIITNVRDRRNWAYQLARRIAKRTGELSHWELHQLTQDDAMDAGIVEEATDAELRAELDEVDYRMTYYNETDGDTGLRLAIENIERRELPEQAAWCRAWDLAATVGGDWTVGAKVAANHEGFWIVDIVRERSEAQGVFDIMRQTAALDGPEVDHVVEEEKGASGKLILESTRERFYQIPTAGPVWPAKVEQNKMIRALPLAGAIQDGKYFLAPHLDGNELMAELEMWPDSRYDDQVDALAHGHLHLSDMVQGLVGSGWTPGQG